MTEEEKAEVMKPGGFHHAALDGWLSAETAPKDGTKILALCRLHVNLWRDNECERLQTEPIPHVLMWSDHYSEWWSPSMLGSVQQLAHDLLGWAPIPNGLSETDLDTKENT